MLISRSKATKPYRLLNRKHILPDGHPKKLYKNLGEYPVQPSCELALEHLSRFTK